jgi:trimethylamine:corrinoid methyltransferase-like protein
MKEVEISEERIAFDVMKGVGPGQEFVTSRHTLQYMRSELTHWDEGKLEMLSRDRDDLVVESRNVVNQLLKDHRVLPVDEDIIRRGDEIIGAYEERVRR